MSFVAVIQRSKYLTSERTAVKEIVVRSEFDSLAGPVPVTLQECAIGRQNNFLGLQSNCLSELIVRYCPLNLTHVQLFKG